MIAGLAGLEPMPRKRGLLSLRAVNSVKTVLGASNAASLTMRMPALAMVSRGTAVTLTGTDFTSAGSFCAVTITVGSVVVGGWLACANEIVGASRHIHTAIRINIRSLFHDRSVFYA